MTTDCLEELALTIEGDTRIGVMHQMVGLPDIKGAHERTGERRENIGGAVVRAATSGTRIMREPDEHHVHEEDVHVARERP